MSETRTSSSYPAAFSNVVESNSGGVSISAYAWTRRRGVSNMSAESIGRPSAASISVAARSALPRSTGAGSWVIRGRDRPGSTSRSN